MGTFCASRARPFGFRDSVPQPSLDVLSPEWQLDSSGAHQEHQSVDFFDCAALTARKEVAAHVSRAPSRSP